MGHALASRHRVPSPSGAVRYSAGAMALRVAERAKQARRAMVARRAPRRVRARRLSAVVAVIGVVIAFAFLSLPVDASVDNDPLMRLRTFDAAPTTAVSVDAASGPEPVHMDAATHAKPPARAQSPSLRSFLAELPEERHPAHLRTDGARLPADRAGARTGKAPPHAGRDDRTAEGLRLPVVTNLFASRDRIARMVGAEPGGFNDAWARALANLIAAATWSVAARCRGRETATSSTPGRCRSAAISRRTPGATSAPASWSARIRTPACAT